MTISPGSTEDAGGEEVPLPLPHAHLFTASGVPACSPPRSPNLCEVTEALIDICMPTHTRQKYKVILRNRVI